MSRVFTYLEAPIMNINTSTLNPKIRIVNFDDDNAAQIINVRHAVFTIEQKIDDKEDLDGRDPTAIHALATINNETIGTGRMTNDGHIGRLVVLKKHRHQGIGSAIVNALIIEAKKSKLQNIYLGAQISAIGFYRKNGFEEYGEIFQEVEIDHIMMKKDITK